MNHLITILLLIFSIMTVTASNPFTGRIQDYNKKPVKNAIIHTGDPKAFIKSDKKGIFTLPDVNPSETIHVKHGKSSITRVRDKSHVKPYLIKSHKGLGGQKEVA